MADLVGSWLERDAALLDRRRPHPVPGFLVEVRLVRVARLRPPACRSPRRGCAACAHPLAPVLPLPLAAACAPALGGDVAAQCAVRVDASADRFGVPERLDLLLGQPGPGR